MAGGTEARWAQAAAFAGALAVLIVVASGWLRVVLVVLAAVIGIPSGLALLSGLPTWKVIGSELRDRRQRRMPRWAAVARASFNLLDPTGSGRSLLFLIRDRTNSGHNITTFYVNQDENPEGHDATCVVTVEAKRYQATVKIKDGAASVIRERLVDNTGARCPVAERYEVTWTSDVFPDTTTSFRMSGDHTIRKSRRERISRVIKRRLRRVRYLVTGQR